jgi:hypothetical protein
LGKASFDQLTGPSDADLYISITLYDSFPDICVPRIKKYLQSGGMFYAGAGLLNVGMNRAHTVQITPIRRSGFQTVIGIAAEFLTASNERWKTYPIFGLCFKSGLFPVGYNVLMLYEVVGGTKDSRRRLLSRFRPFPASREGGFLSYCLMNKVEEIFKIR